MFAATTPVSGKAVNLCVHGANGNFAMPLEVQRKNRVAMYNSLAGKGSLRGKDIFAL